jgi:hypothetical protein
MSIQKFKKELKELMIKHNIDTIGLDFDDCSDTHGMVGEEMTITTMPNKKTRIFDTHTICWGYGFDRSDL